MNEIQVLLEENKKLMTKRLQDYCLLQQANAKEAKQKQKQREDAEQKSKKKHKHKEAPQGQKMTHMDIIIEEYLNLVSVRQLHPSELQKRVAQYEQQEQNKNYNGDQEYAPTYNL